MADTDFEKWTKFLKSMSIPFTDVPIPTEGPSARMLQIGCSNGRELGRNEAQYNRWFADETESLDIVFDKNGAFIRFQAYNGDS